MPRVVATGPGSGLQLETIGRLEKRRAAVDKQVSELDQTVFNVGWTVLPEGHARRLRACRAAARRTQAWRAVSTARARKSPHRPSTGICPELETRGVHYCSTGDTTPPDSAWSVVADKPARGSRRRPRIRGQAIPEDLVRDGQVPGRPGNRSVKRGREFHREGCSPTSGLRASSQTRIEVTRSS